MNRYQSFFSTIENWLELWSTREKICQVAYDKCKRLYNENILQFQHYVSYCAIYNSNSVFFYLFGLAPSNNVYLLKWTVMMVHFLYINLIIAAATPLNILEPLKQKHKIWKIIFHTHAKH